MGAICVLSYNDGGATSIEFEWTILNVRISAFCIANEDAMVREKRERGERKRKTPSMHVYSRGRVGIDA